ncbi:MAG: DUF2997 domain-containing protein [Synechococcaceae cyanobacterium]|nr:DUF2997 domain-containing protein [Synechococcaceae cyanobacterium]
MAQLTIRYRIRPDGRVEERVEGVAGPACTVLSERIEARIGSVQQRLPSAEAYQAETSSVASEQQLLGRSL